MVRRGNGDGSVRGPTSALTSFLKDQGIRSRNIRNGWSRREDGEAGAATPPVAGPSGTSSPGGPATPSGLSSVAETPDDDDDETEAEDRSSIAGPSRSSAPGTPATEDNDLSMDIEASSSRRVSVKASTSKGASVEVSSSTKRKSSTHVESSKKKKAKKGGSDDEYSDDGEIQMKVVGAPKARYADRKPGSFAMCAECNKKFTVTRYTNPHPDISGGLLCGPCDKEIGPAVGQVPGGKGKSSASGEASKKRARAVKAKVVLNKEKPTVMSLTKCCIEIIGKAIEDVEEFGDIGSVNKDRLCQIVCKNRDLTQETVKLFLDVETTSLTLYDCTRLEPEALRMLANHCPNVEELKLFMCGFMDDTTILHYATRLTSLKHLQLYAAFLVRKEGWHKFFDILAEQGRGLEGFCIRQTPRLDNGVLERLVRTSPNLTHLQLAECGLLDDNSLGLLHGLKNLKSLDLTKGGQKGENFTDEGIISLLENVGESLQTLILDENLLLTDRTLIEGVKVNCPNLIELSLRNLGELLPTGIAELFSEDWVNQRGMVRININRCIQLDDQALEAMIRHSGKTLVKLDMNSVDQVTEQSLKLLAESMPYLTELDVSFVRMVDDFLLKHMLENLPAIQRICIYGDNRISDMCPQKAGVKILGHEQGMVNFD